MIQVTSKLTYVCFVVKVANLGNASDNTSGFQSFLNRISLWFRSLSHCFGNCFGGSATDDDQLLRDGPSHSNSADQFPQNVSDFLCEISENNHFLISSFKSQDSSISLKSIKVKCI